MTKRMARSTCRRGRRDTVYIGLVGPWRGDIANGHTRVARLADPRSPIGPFDILLVTFVGEAPTEWTDVLALAVANGKAVRHLAEYLESARGRVLAGGFDSARVTGDRAAGYRFRKPLFDITIIVVTLPASLPLLALIALAILVTMGWPFLFPQQRLGQNGAAFRMWKFRTMCKVAGGAPVTAVDDARITPLGGFLRRAHVDELPQLVNVLCGQMSLVGPRPEQPELARDYTRQLPAFAHRLLVPAGMTGWAQINSPYAGDFAQSEIKLSFDMYYMVNRSHALDLEILARTLCDAIIGLFGR